MAFPEPCVAVAADVTNVACVPVNTSLMITTEWTQRNGRFGAAASTAAVAAAASAPLRSAWCSLGSAQLEIRLGVIISVPVYV